MSATGNETLDRIQQEIKETLEREDELRRKYNKLNNNDDTVESSVPNGVKIPLIPNGTKLLTNGNSQNHLNDEVKSTPKTNGTRLFAPQSTRGVMQKFIRMRGKLGSVTSLRNTVARPTSWTPRDPVEPPKLALEPGKDIRNGFISAEEKMRRELREFQKREDELRVERRKSQPDLMAALEAERQAESNGFGTTKSLYGSGDLTDDSGAGSLKNARSLSDLLCDEVDSPGTFSLIKQFENWNNRA